ncbi:glycosyl transferase family 90 [Paracoccus nototheniae]|uniref:Glycosyl transferase family 90 n=1 Tax=Paracoccus nototheniae TaxID=2489002 RepID=A0ABW4DRX1_9RHOB|nr:glycosyl transferase family 90 [Paracoccus nototheniae]
MAAPVIIHIGPDGPADRVLARMFEANGHPVAHHEGGRLAADILYAMGQGKRPLRDWPQARLFAGLFRHKPHWRPPLEAWRCAAFLRKALPHAHFLLTIPSPEDWSLTRAGTDALACHAFDQAHRPDPLPPAALPALWQDQLADHLDRMRALFGDDPRLIEADLAIDSPADLAARLNALLPMTQVPRARWPGRDTAPGKGLMVLLDSPDPAPAPLGWAEDVARFCLAGLDPLAPGSGDGLSPHACHWDGERVTSANGALRQFAAVAAPGDPPVALAREGRHFKLIRAEGVINDILRLNRRDPVWIDMEDSRWLGSPQGAALDRPVLCHNRRAGAVNAVLWPLPDQHAIGLPGFDPGAAPDDIPFEDKEDRLVWRGMISGSEMRPGVKPGAASHTWLARLADAPTPEARAEAWQGLCRTNRMDFIRRLQGHPDVDIGIVMAPAFRHFADDPLLAPYCRPRMAPAQFRRFRYQLCLTGYDHGSNFISGLDQNGVLLAEDDGWQVFYSGRFRPWVHFIPVARHAADIHDKLAWARAHPDECRAMSQAARAEAAHLRDPAARVRMMQLILDGLAKAR